MSITSFRAHIDGKDKISPYDDYFNFRNPNINTSGIQAVKLISAQIPWCWPNIRVGVNNTFKITVFMGSQGRSYDLTFTLPYKVFRDLDTLLADLNTVFDAQIYNQLVGPWPGGPYRLQIYKTTPIDTGKINLSFQAVTTWGGSTLNPADLSYPQIKYTEGILSEMLGFEFRSEFASNKIKPVTSGTASAFCTGNGNYNIIPTKVIIKSEFLTRYIERGAHISKGIAIEIPLSNFVYNSNILFETELYFNHNPVGGQGSFIDFNCFDDYGPIQSFNPYSRLQVVLDFYEDAHDTLN